MQTHSDHFWFPSLWCNPFIFLICKTEFKVSTVWLLGLNEMRSVKASFGMLASLLSAHFLTVFSCPCIQHPCHGVWTTFYLRGSLPRAESFWFSGWSWGGLGCSLRTFIPSLSWQFGCVTRWHRRESCVDSSGPVVPEPEPCHVRKVRTSGGVGGPWTQCVTDPVPDIWRKCVICLLIAWFHCVPGFVLSEA